MKFVKEIEKIYEKNKNLENPPSYVKLIERLLELEKIDKGI